MPLTLALRGCAAPGSMVYVHTGSRAREEAGPQKPLDKLKHQGSRFGKKKKLREVHDEQEALARREQDPVIAEMKKEFEQARGLMQQEVAPPHWFLDNIFFKGFIFSLVFISCLQLGLEAEHPQLVATWSLCENVFTTAFTAEAIIKLYFLHFDYFRDTWNLLDFSLAIMSILDVWVLGALGLGEGLKNFTILRMLRLVRLTRAVRVVRNFKRLLVMIHGIVDALKAALWVSLALLLGIYVCAIFCKTVFDGTDKALLYPGYTTDVGLIEQQDLFVNFNPHVQFGSLGRCMLTLFNMATMMEWGEVLWPLAFKQPAMLAFFLPFLILMSYGVLNVVVGMIVDNVMQHARAAEKEEDSYNLQCKMFLLDQIQDLWKDLQNQDGAVDVDSLEKEMNNPESQLRALLKLVELPKGFRAKDLVAMLDEDGDLQLTHDEFVESLYRLLDCGPFQQSCLIQKGLNEVKNFTRELSEKLDNLEQVWSRENSPGRSPIKPSGSDNKRNDFEDATLVKRLECLQTKIESSTVVTEAVYELPPKRHMSIATSPSDVNLTEAARKRDHPRLARGVIDASALLVEMDRMLRKLETAIRAELQVPAALPGATSKGEARPATSGMVERPPARVETVESERRLMMIQGVMDALNAALRDSPSCRPDSHSRTGPECSIMEL